MALSFQSVALDTDGPDQEATLVFRDGRLLAILSCLSNIHAELTGSWFVEAGFGNVPARRPQVFKSLALFEEWFAGEQVR